jgi:hypothetical protein
MTITATSIHRLALRVIDADPRLRDWPERLSDRATCDEVAADWCTQASGLCADVDPSALAAELHNQGLTAFLALPDEDKP